MATSIAFTDGVGAATLTNGVPAPGDRFRGWKPRRTPVGASETALGTGRRFMFAFRRDYSAAFSLDEIPMASLSTVLRLIDHLESGGTCTVNTGDNASRSYATCGLAEGSTPELSQQDASNLTYSLSLMLVNLGAESDMICDYTDQ